jgi:hypothetical protein
MHRMNSGNFKPYNDKIINESEFIRKFEDGISNDHLVWHRDKTSREIFVLDGSDWYLQLDNELPKQMEVNKTYFIHSLVYHRILNPNRVKSPLILRIKEL